MIARRGFTLVELLVTVAIVALLAALIIPGMQRAMAVTHRARCQGNLRQIGAAMFAYASDNDNRIPAVYISDAAPSWVKSIWTYAGYAESTYTNSSPGLVGADRNSQNIFRCTGTRAKAIAAPGVGGVNGNKYSYGLNCGPLYDPSTPADIVHTPIPLAKVTWPSLTAMVTECSYSQGDYNGYRSWFGMIPHLGGSNVLYYDGHVEWFLYANMPSGDWDPFWAGKPPPW